MDRVIVNPTGGTAATRAAGQLATGQSPQCHDLRVATEPPAAQWPALIAHAADAADVVLGRPIHDWRTLTRRELGLPVDRPIVATGHQAAFWHPGILAKYIAVAAAAEQIGGAAAHVVVDHDANAFAHIEAPVQFEDGRIAARRIAFGDARPDVPSSCHPPLDPPTVPPLHAPLPGVADGVQRMRAALIAHHDAPNAALQVARATMDLARPWAGAMPAVTASDLMNTTLAHAMLEAIAADAHRCAQAYNAAVRAVPEAGMSSLLIRADYIEVPLWRLRDDEPVDVRLRAYDDDVEAVTGAGPARTPPPRLLPRALFMTAMLRLAVCDLFVHGTGGMVYDRAMEHWLRDWLGVRVSPMAMVTADLCLPLTDAAARDGEAPRSAALQRLRHLWHDPPRADSGNGPAPSHSKRQWLDAISAASRGSLERRERFLAMHDALDRWRTERRAVLADAWRQAEAADIAWHNRAVAARRDWPFPLYPDACLDALRRTIRDRMPTAAMQPIPASRH